ncbi:ABC transporter substrate-binding protein [Ruania alba]|uniref:Peptide/nickel transport system substrate-binding protein n=1 Tax=Ruania alba TaxID=648782 RepID=A0A1H5HRV8_9MICO|nr:ABC transporter substrate-binding protein [Ruania alba]SEE29998.1 peptide/nickel transport system substrate-binding protein [Ruania alba]
MVQHRWWIGGALVGALGLTGCGFSGGSTDTDGETGGEGDAERATIGYVEAFSPSSGFAIGSDDAFILTRIGCLETLLRYTPDGEVVPEIATEWVQSEPTTWEFTVREASFQDGSAVTAEAVVTALQDVIDSDTPPRSFNHETIAGIEAADEATVRISTPEPDPLLPLRVTSPTTGILAPSAYGGEQVDPVGTCTGPFEITDIASGVSISLEAYDDYWGGTPGLDGVEVQHISDGEARVTQLRTGETDISANLPAVAMTQLEGDESIVAEPFELPRTTGMLFNLDQEPFDEEVVRDAIRTALDLDEIVDAVYEGFAAPAVGPFASSAPWAPEAAAPVESDPDAAVAMLSGAGIDPASIDFELIAYTDQVAFADLSQVIQAQLAEIGITVTIRSGAYASVEQDLLDGNYDATLLSRSTLTDVPDPGGFLSSDYGCDGGYNLSNHCDPDVEAVLQEALATSDDDTRYGLYAEMASMLQERAVTAFLVHEYNTYGVSADIAGYVDDPLGQRVITTDLTMEAP